MLAEIDIQEIENIKIGNSEDMQGGTGCTVVLCPQGASAGVDIRGGGSASRETDLCSPRSAADKIHAVLLSGGSAFGLDAAAGVMEYLKEKNVGFDTGIMRVPLVCASCIYDLVVGKSDVFPDKKMGYSACEAAECGDFKAGSHGVGTGATVGKLCGPDFMMKSGLGSAAVRLGDLKVGALAVVNALGDIYDSMGRIIAGLLSEDKKSFRNSEHMLYKLHFNSDNLFTGNTTLGIIITNAAADKARMGKVASMAHNGMARAVRPVHTSADGDTVYALSVGDVSSSADVLGTLASYVMQKAIENATLCASSLYGLMTAGDFTRS